MKHTNFILFILLFLTGCKLAPTNNNYIIVPKDYSTIQSAIDASANGDTILVEPGTYYENINFMGKEITLTSKFILDGNEEYISNTIIDGNNNGSVVTFENGETNNTELIGFTIQNGRMFHENIGGGGGIRCKKSSPTFEFLIIKNNYGSVGGGISLDGSNSIIRNCQISYNESDQEGGGAGIYMRDSSYIEIYDTRIYKNTCVNDDPSGELVGSLQGAGILIWRSTLYLSNVSIHDNNINNKFGVGGGIRAAFSNLEFDNVNRCNIYNNTIAYSVNALDLCTDWWDNSDIIEVYLDTFTVMNPTDHYAYPIENFTFDIQNSYLDQPALFSDYYVNPNIGSDTNSGASPEEAFKSITHILNSYPGGEGDSAAIHLANGIYSSTSNSEIFPLLPRSNVSLIGESEENAIIDAEGKSGVISVLNIKNSELSNCTIINGSDYYGVGGIKIYTSNFNLNNVTVKNCISDFSFDYSGGAVFVYQSVSNMKFVSIISNPYSGGLRVNNSKLQLHNSIISGNDCYGYGAGIMITDTSDVDLQNVIINNNQAGQYSGVLLTDSELNISNAVIINNTITGSNTSNKVFGAFGGVIQIENTIIWNNYYSSISTTEPWWTNFPTNLSISHSNIKNGLSGVFVRDQDTLNWHEGNIDTDPLFVDPENGDFHLQPGSPCIDTGNPDAQYNDVDGSRNDMGAYGGPGGDW